MPPGKVDKKLHLASAKLDEAQKQSARLDKAAGEALRQLTEAPSQAWILERKFSFLKLEMGKVAEAREDVIGSAVGQS